jgi:hypothetical protein
MNHSDIIVLQIPNKSFGFASEKDKTLINYFVNGPKNVVNLMVTPTYSIKYLNNEARIILDRLDDAIEGMIDDDKIIDDWFEARKIKGHHVPVKKENGVENGSDNKTIVK